MGALDGGNSPQREQHELWPQESGGFAYEADVAGSWPVRERAVEDEMRVEGT